MRGKEDRDEILPNHGCRVTIKTYLDPSMVGSDDYLRGIGLSWEDLETSMGLRTSRMRDAGICMSPS